MTCFYHHAAPAATAPAANGGIPHPNGCNSQPNAAPAARRIAPITQGCRRAPSITQVHRAMSGQARTQNSGCPTLATSLYLSLGWGQHKPSVPHPSRRFITPWVARRSSRPYRRPTSCALSGCASTPLSSDAATSRDPAVRTVAMRKPVCHHVHARVFASIA